AQVWIVLAAAVINVALMLFAVPRWGINGAAGASAVAFLLAIALTVALGRRHVALPLPLGACGSVVLAAGVMGMLLLPFRSNVGAPAVVAQIFGGAAAYATVLFVCDFMGLRTRWTARRRNRLGAAGSAAAGLAPALSEVL